MIDSPAPLGIAEVARALHVTPALIRSQTEALPPAAATWHPAPESWCVQQIIGHLLEAERRGFADRIRLILRGHSPALPVWNQAAVAKARRDCERDLPALLDEFGEAREQTLQLLAGLRPSDLTKSGDHPKAGTLRVQDLLQEWVYHDSDHVRQILANVQAFLWANMGNARRMYD